MSTILLMLRTPIACNLFFNQVGDGITVTPSMTIPEYLLQPALSSILTLKGVTDLSLLACFLKGLIAATGDS